MSDRSPQREPRTLVQIYFYATSEALKRITQFGHFEFEAEGAFFVEKRTGRRMNLDSFYWTVWLNDFVGHDRSSTFSRELTEAILHARDQMNYAGADNGRIDKHTNFEALWAD